MELVRIKGIFLDEGSFADTVNELTALRNSCKLAMMQDMIFMQATLLNMEPEYLANLHNDDGPP
jgi:hypothetical protein